MLKLLKYELIHEWRSYGIIYLVFIEMCIRDRALTSKGTDYLESVGFWPTKDEKSMPLLDHLTFEKIHE